MKLALIIFWCAIVTAFSILDVSEASSLTLTRKIPIANVKGRIDHFSIDLKGERLFVCALGNNTIEVIDLKSSIRIHTITGLSEPQGVLFVPADNKLYATNGATGECDIFNGDTFNIEGRIKLTDDADNIRYDAAAGLIYVGYGDGSICVIDSSTGRQTGDIKLSGHPEAFEIEPDGNRIFVNVPSARHIAVADRKKMAVETIWPIKNESSNFPMALDANSHRLFVGCRHPAKLLVFDTHSGKTVQEINIDGDADDIFCDRKSNRVYISCGEGYIDVLQGLADSGYKVLEKIPTVTGARTSIFVSEQGCLFVAIPAGHGQTAEIWVYKTNNL